MELKGTGVTVHFRLSRFTEVRNSTRAPPETLRGIFHDGADVVAKWLPRVDEGQAGRHRWLDEQTRNSPSQESYPRDGWVEGWEVEPLRRFALAAAKSCAAGLQHSPLRVTNWPAMKHWLRAERVLLVRTWRRHCVVGAHGWSHSTIFPLATRQPRLETQADSLKFVEGDVADEKLVRRLISGCELDFS